MDRIPNHATSIVREMGESRIARLVRAAQLYYEEDQSQHEVAAAMGISRASVSRLLAEARREGIVSITISRPFEHLERLEHALEDVFQLKRAVVVPTSIDDEATMDVVGRAAAELFADIVHEEIVVGISWGRTMNRFVRAVQGPQIARSTVIQMLGGLGAGDPAIDGPELARRLAGKLHTPYRLVSAPAIVATPEDGNRLRAVPAVRDALEIATRADVAMFSVGTLHDPDTSLSRAGYLTEEERLELLALGGVGHVLAKIIRSDGSEVKSFNDKVVAIDLASLHNMAWSVCVASSLEKAEMMLGVLRGGYANCVIVDSQLAEAILRARTTDSA